MVPIRPVGDAFGTLAGGSGRSVGGGMARAMAKRRARSVGAAVALAVAVLLVARCGGPGAPSPSPSTSSTTASTVARPAPTSTDPPGTSAATTSSVPGTSATTTSGVPGSGGAASTAEELLAGLVVRTADPAAPYVRDLFDGGGWAYDPETGCNTRERVLIDESVIEPQVDDRCRTTLGRWRSLYDGATTDDPADLQVDHVVPLADAWRSGAAAWTSERRLAFANDLTSPDTLLAVSGSTNMSKGDSTPAEWLPPDPTARCPYVEQWVRVKAAWDLSVTAPEKQALARLLAAC